MSNPSNVLLLNASFEPMGVISAQKAFCLMLTEKVFEAAEGRIILRSVNNQFGVPTVVRLKRYINVPRLQSHWNRIGVLKRDGFKCIYCGESCDRHDKQSMPTIDHIKPRALGGKNTWTNTACACMRCNTRKGSRTPEQAGMRLRWEPKTPRVGYIVASGNIPDDWKMYIQTD